MPANSRLTVNVEAEDPLLRNAAVSTTVTSNVPVISERAMYWPGAFTTWFEAHNSFGVTEVGDEVGAGRGPRRRAAGVRDLHPARQPERGDGERDGDVPARPTARTVVKT